MMTYAMNHSTTEAEASRSRVKSQPGYMVKSRLPRSCLRKTKANKTKIMNKSSSLTPETNISQDMSSCLFALQDYSQNQTKCSSTAKSIKKINIHKYINISSLKRRKEQGLGDR